MVAGNLQATGFAPAIPAGCNELAVCREPAQMKHRILVIEDDPAIGPLLALQLSEPGVDVELQCDGAAGLRRAAAMAWDLYIVDRMLPDIDGLTVCRNLRARGGKTPVIFLTARDTDADRIEGLDAGADDYIGKPFGIGELKARVRAQLRRSELLGRGTQGQTDDDPLEAGGVQIDPRARLVTRSGTPVNLTEREFQLLRHLMLHRERAWTRDQLLDRVWGPGYEGYAHTVNSHINRLRAKLEPDPARPRLIVTVWGTGYRFHACAD
jgi:two-component system OmpR family response regulator